MSMRPNRQGTLERPTPQAAAASLGAGRSFPLGDTIVSGGVNFSVFSRQATGSATTHDKVTTFGSGRQMNAKLPRACER
jgi:hypothetical protein